MRMVGIREARETLSGLVERAQRERIILTRHGRPAALMVGIEGKDLEQVLLETDVDFWRELARRGEAGRTISSAAMRTRLGMPAKRTGRRKGRSR